MLSVLILGSNAAVPAHGRHLTSALVSCGKHLFMLDCGEGTQMRMSDFHVRRGLISHIFITHLHGDHLFGLPGLLTSLSFQRKKPLYLYGPEGLEEFVQTAIRVSGSYLPYPLVVRHTDPSLSERIYEDDFVSVDTLPLRHRVPTNGYLFREKTIGRHRLIPEKLEAYGIPHSGRGPLTLGADYVAPDGSRVPNAAFALPPLPPVAFAFCTDTAYHPPLVPLIQGVDLLYHESTFLSDMQEHAVLTMHSTALEAGRIAAAAGAKRLLLGHFSSRYQDLRPLEEEARTVFSASEAATEGVWYRV